MTIFRNLRMNNLKSLWLSSLIALLFASSTPSLHPDAKSDFNQKSFDMGSIVAKHPLDMSSDDPEDFAKMAEEALVLMASFEPSSFDILLFKNALNDAKFTESDNPLQSKIDRINEVAKKLGDFLASSPRDKSILTGGAPAPAPTGDFVPLVDYISDKYKELRSKSDMSATEADSFSTELDEFVKKEAPGVVDSNQMSTIKLRMRSIANHELFEGDEKSTARDNLTSALNFLDDVTLSKRIEFLDRVWDRSDKVFGKGKGESRFLTVVDYIAQRFEQLTQDDLDSLYWILEEASGRDDFGPNTQQVAKSLLSTKSWIGGAATTPGDEDDDEKTPEILSPADLKKSVETAEANLNSKLIRLVSEDEYEGFLGELEAAVSNYRELIETGEIKLQPAEGEIKDPLIEKIEKLSERVANNYRFQKSPHKEKTTDIYNLAMGNLSLDQKLDRYSRDQVKVKNDTDAINFVDRFKNDLVFNEDGSLKESIGKMSEEEKDAIIAYVKSLRNANFFGAAGQELSRIETTIKSGVGIDQLISDMQQKLNSVSDLTGMESFLIGLRDLKVKFDGLRVKGDITETQRTNMIDLIKSTQDGSRFWRLRQGKTKVEMNSMIASLKNPLSLADRISAMKQNLGEIKDNPETVDLDDIDGLYNQTVKLVDDWQTARAIGLSEAAQNTELLAYLDALSKSDEFYDYKSNFTSMIDRVKKSLSQERKVELIFDHMDSVLGSADPAPKQITNFISSATLLSEDLDDLTGAQRTNLRAKVDSARNSEKFSATQKSELLSVENKLKDFEESGDTGSNAGSDTGNDAGDDVGDDVDGDAGDEDPAPDPDPAPAPSPAARRRTPQRFSISRSRRPTVGGNMRTSSYGSSSAGRGSSRGIRASYRARR